MPLGFNSNVELGRTIYHVQTEDRGAGHPFIDTVVLLGGRVLHRRSTSYEDLLADGAADPNALSARVEQQHREILEALRAGTLPVEKSPAEGSSPVEIKLRNPAAWLSGGEASLDIEVCSRSDGQPIANAEVRVRIDGMGGNPLHFAAQTNADGRVRVKFSFPGQQGPGAAALVVQARTAQGVHQLRYRLKPRNAPQPPR